MRLYSMPFTLETEPALQSTNNTPHARKQILRSPVSAVFEKEDQAHQAHYVRTSSFHEKSMRDECVRERRGSPACLFKRYVWIIVVILLSGES